jgi:hypothetical protein
MNGANLRRFSDVAPSGHERFSPKTQGGAGACPGLWEVAPLGLKLVPFEAVMHFWRTFAGENFGHLKAAEGGPIL